VTQASLYYPSGRRRRCCKCESKNLSLTDRFTCARCGHSWRPGSGSSRVKDYSDIEYTELTAVALATAFELSSSTAVIREKYPTVLMEATVGTTAAARLSALFTAIVPSLGAQFVFNYGPDRAPRQRWQIAGWDACMALQRIIAPHLTPNGAAKLDDLWTRFTDTPEGDNNERTA